MSRLLFLALALLFASSSAPAAETPTRASGDLAIQAREILRKHCSGCHTGNPDPGRRKLNVMEYTDVIAKDRPVPAVTPGGRSQLLELIKDGSMPPGNRPGPTPAEIGILEKWVSAQAPAYPVAFDERYTLEAIADDIASAKDRNVIRYASFAHRIRDGETPDLLTEERRLIEAFSLANAGAPVKIEAVDPAATLYRIELPKTGWGGRDLFRQWGALGERDPFTLRPFDLIHLEYPFASRFPADDPLAKRLQKFLGEGNQIPRVPFVRGDWLSTAIAREGKLTPLGEDVKSLVALDLAVERSAPKPDGPRLPRLLGGEALSLPKATVDGRTSLPPLSAWYTGSIAFDPAPFELTANLVSDGQVVKEVKVDQPFKLRVHSDHSRSVHVTVLIVQADGEVAEPPLRNGPIRLPPKKTEELTPEERPFKIPGITTRSNSATEYMVVFASEVELQVLVVKSQHREQPVWRFLVSSTDAKFDPNKVVRKVIPIPVTRK